MGSQGRWGTRCGVSATAGDLPSTPALPTLRRCPLRRDGGNADNHGRQRVEVFSKQATTLWKQTRTAWSDQQSNNAYKPVLLPNGKQVDVHVNEDNDERRLQDPIIYDPEDYPEDKLRDAMQREMASMKDFGVYEEVPLHDMHNHDNGSIIQTRWVHRWKGELVKSRLVAKGYAEQVLDVDDTYASTPVLVILRTLITLALTHNWTMTTGDISTAFLHAPITKEEEVYVTPPPEYYPNGDTLWKLKRAMYGLRTSPKAWQDHFAGQLQQCGLVRLKSDPNVYADYKHKVYVLVYVDDVFFFGPSDHVHDKIKALQEKVLLKLTGELAPGKSVTFLGRVLHHHGTHVTFASLDGYIEDILQAHDMTKCNPATTTGSDSFERLLDGDDALTTEQHKQYRRAVGKIQWLAPLRPDICYAAKELARGLAAPTKEHQAKLKQLLRYLKGTVDHMIMIKPMTFPGLQQPFEIECYVDSDWAGCHTTRESTSGLVLQLFGATLLTASRTQATIALSSG